nr:alpha-L-fucosidase [Paenibacillus sp. AR247]
MSKNGCLLLNFGPKPDGTIPKEQVNVLEQLGDWLRTNGEAIYDTRPYETFGEGPTSVGGDALSERKNQVFTAQDIRFKRSKGGNALYAVLMAAPTTDCIPIESLGTIKSEAGEIESVSILGIGEIEWTQKESGLHAILLENHGISSLFAIKIKMRSN